MMRKYADEPLHARVPLPARSPVVAQTPVAPALSPTPWMRARSPLARPEPRFGPSPEYLPGKAAERLLQDLRIRAGHAPAVQAKPQPGASAPSASPASVQQRLGEGEAMEPSAAKGDVGASTVPMQLARAGGCTCSQCSRDKAREDEERRLREAGIQRAAAPEGGPMRVDAGSIQARLTGGTPLPAPVAERFSQAYGRDLSNVRVHANSPLAPQVGARAFTVGRDVAFAPGEYKPGTPAGDRLIGHELAHVVQQAGGAGAVQGAGLGEDGYEREADRAAETAVSGGSVSSLSPVGGGPLQMERGDGGGDAAPCSVVEGTLTNAGLLQQLNRARAYLATTPWGEGQSYDYANLLRRLSAERKKRAREGHVWLAESGLADQIPATLYQVTPDGPQRFSVQQVAGVTAAEGGAPTGGILVTPAQFHRLLELNHLPQVDAAQYFGARKPGDTSPLGVNLPASLAPVQSPRAMTLAPGAPGIQVLPWPSAMAPSFGLPAATTASASQPHASSSWSMLLDASAAPESISAVGPEAVRVPVGRHRNAFSSLGYLARPKLPIPENAAGIIWEGSHTSEFSAAGGGFEEIRGFRGEFWLHSMRDVAYARTGGKDNLTRTLNRGTPGRYWNDWLFPYSVWGEPVAVYRVTSMEEALQLGAEMRAAASGMDGRPRASVLEDFIPTPSRWREVNALGKILPEDRNSYRYSTPPREGKKGPASYDKAFGVERPGFCPPGANSCINRPIEIIEKVLGGPGRFVIPQEDGTLLVIATPENATATNMNRYTAHPNHDASKGPVVPDSFFEQNGLVRVPIGSTMRARVWAPGVAGGATALVGDAWQAATGEGEVHWVRDPLIGATSAVIASPIEAELSRRAAIYLADHGLSATSGSAASLFLGGGGRVLGGAPVALAAAPLITALSMSLDDRKYTSIDYAAAMGRSTVAAGGGLVAVALANGAYFAIAGSEAPGLGNVAGFIIGFGGTLIVDGLFGDDVEAGIRSALGEQGCTGGVKANR